MTHFRNRQWKQWVDIRGHLKHDGGDFVLLTDPSQKRMSEQTQGDMAIPSDPTSDFVVVEAEIFGIFKVLLDMPTLANGLDHLLQGGSLGGKDEGVGFFVRTAHTATHEQPMSCIIFPLLQDGNNRPVKKPGAFGALTHREALPILGVKQEGFNVADFHPPSSPIGSQDPDGFVAGDCQHLGARLRLQPGPQVQTAPIDRICNNPGNGDLSLPEAFEHLLGQFTLRLKTNSFRNACFSTPL